MRIKDVFVIGNFKKTLNERAVALVPCVKISIGPVYAKPIDPEGIIKIVFNEDELPVGRLAVEVKVILVVCVAVPVSYNDFRGQCFKVMVDLKIAFHVTREIVIAEVVEGV